jgi:hypothetical protein
MRLHNVNFLCLGEWVVSFGSWASNLAIPFGSHCFESIATVPDRNTTPPTANEDEIAGLVYSPSAWESVNESRGGRAGLVHVAVRE